ncbi:hypothetical protein [Streptomyces sp. NPDC051909]|uniref:hypothetical protein n=1 Tax=Streptomyces sp. NPDC051909 TaxID=3154944 RepID=UPI00343910EC
MLQPPESTLFVRATVPVLVLADSPLHDALPPYAPPAPLTQPLALSGWGLVPRLTLCVVDGPGEHGVMIPSFVAPVVGEGTLADWCADAERAGGAIVLSTPELPLPTDLPALPDFPTTRGGFVPLLAA